MTRIDTTDAAAFSPAAIKPRVSIGDLDNLAYPACDRAVFAPEPRLCAAPRWPGAAA